MPRAEVPVGHDAPVGQVRRLADFIRERRDDIVADWLKCVRGMPRAGTLDQEALINEIPQMLDRIAGYAAELAAGSASRLPSASVHAHAIMRLDSGFDLPEVVEEFRLLRQSILRIWYEASREETCDLRDVRVLDDAIDTAIADSVERFNAVRDRTLKGFDQIAAVTVESTNLDELLRELLRVLRDVTPSIDTAAIYLRDGDKLRVRAAVGVGREVEVGFTLHMGEGFAGGIAARREPAMLRDAIAEHVKSPILQIAHLSALYGVPLLVGDHVMGVATMGSLTAHDFSLQDKNIFAALTARASAAIQQHVLREEADRSTAQLLDMQEQFRTLADSIPQLAWMAHADGMHYWFNRRWFEYTGCTIEETSEMRWRQVHHPDHLDRVLASWRKAIAAGELWEDSYPLRRHDGQFRWFLTRAIPVRDATGRVYRWFGTATDITERRLFDRVSETLARSLQFDETFEALAHLFVPDFADVCVVELLEAGQLEQVAIAGADPARREATPGVAEVIRTGRPALVSETWLAAPLCSRGRTLGAISFIIGASTRRFAATDIPVAAELGRRAGVAVENALLYREAQQAVRQRDQLLATVSHDLRNPLATVDLGTTMLAESVTSDPRATRHLELVRKSADRMSRLIDDLLDMASINAGRFAIVARPVDTKRVVTEVLDAQESLARKRAVEILRDVELGSVQMLCDHDRLAQVFANIVGNALKFCRQGDVIFVRATVEDGARVRFTIRDTGPGIAPHDLPHIFEPFWSGDGSTKGRLGLGLFISKAIVEAHGGEITATSTVGQGATFSFTIPVAGRS